MSTGRPRAKIDRNEFEYLCRIMCTEEEIAGFFNIHIDTLCNWCKRTYGETFSEVYKKISSQGKCSLRRFQFKMAEKNATMAIWLGKQWLGQKDTIDATATIQADDGLIEALNESARRDWGEDV